jgi:hypothetical protein
VFLVSAVVMWLRKPDDEEAAATADKPGFWRTA